MSQQSRNNSVKDLLLKIQQFCILRGNTGFNIKEFETFFQLPTDKNRLVKIAETGARQGKFLIHCVKNSIEGSKIYLDHQWAEDHDLPPPPEEADMHSGRRKFMDKLLDDKNRPILTSVSTEGEILEHWITFYKSGAEADLDISVDHLQDDYDEFMKKNTRGRRDTTRSTDKVGSIAGRKRTKSDTDSSLDSSESSKPARKKRATGRTRPIVTVRMEPSSPSSSSSSSSSSSGSSYSEDTNEDVAAKKEEEETRNKGGGPSTVFNDDGITFPNDFLYETPLNIKKYPKYARPLEKYMDVEGGNLYLIKFPSEKFPDDLKTFQKKGRLAFHPDKGGSREAMYLFDQAVKFYEDHHANADWVKVYTGTKQMLSIVDSNALIRKLVHATCTC